LDAVRYVAHDTGYEWLDASNEMIAEDYWDIQTVDALAKIWLLIKPILERFGKLAHWMHTGSEAQKAKRFKLVKALVANCTHGMEEAEIEITSRPLIEIFAEAGLLDADE
jgi:hypothetical protein